MIRHFRFTAAAIAALLLLAPALWNGFPLLQYDTGGYLARWYEGHLEESRSTVYGLYLTALARPDFWPVLVVAALLTVWVLWLTLRAHGLSRPGVLLAIVGALTVLTTLPWLASTLLTDIFAGLSVLALYLVTMRADTLARWERWALMVLIAFAASTHTATLAVLAALLLAGLALAPFKRAAVPLAGLGRGAIALALSVAMLLAANYAVAGRLAWTPGGQAIVFGRMLQAGIVASYLKEHCPDPRLPKLCEHREKIPNNADLFFWGSDLFDELGRFQGLSDEMRVVVRESLTAYPLQQIAAAVAATAQQLVRVATGYGVHTEIWHTIWIIEQYAPQAVPAMQAARQQQGALDFTVVNLVHRPVAWISLVLLIGLLAFSLRRPHLARLRELAAVGALAIVANAMVCGGLSNPNDRYGSRMIWLAPLILLVAAAARPRTPQSKTDMILQKNPHVVH